MNLSPVGWKYLRLEEVCVFHRGLTYSKKDERDTSSNAVLRANNISLDKGELDLSEVRFIDDQIEIPRHKMVRKGSLLICMASGSKKHLGKVAFIAEDYPYAFGGFMGLLVPTAAVDPKYLYWITRSKSYSDFIMGLSDGANINNLKFGQLGQYRIPVPPLPEQKRIVAILDEAFAGIDAAVANTEKNLANARELFESYLTSTLDETMAKSCAVPLERHVRFIDYRGKTPVKTNSGIRLLTAKNVRMGFLKREPEEFISSEGFDCWMTRGIPLRGDVLFTTEAPLGMVCQLDTDERVALAQRIITMQPDRAIIDPGYLCYVLRSPVLQSRIHEQATGATATGIKASLLRKITIPLVAMQDQQELVARLESVEEKTAELRASIENRLTSLTELKQSLLAKAFSGELTASPEKEIETASA